MGQAADHFECVLKAFDGMSTPKQDAGLLDDVIQEPGKVCAGAFFLTLPSSR
jgi:hypothetical protein